MKKLLFGLGFLVLSFTAAQAQSLQVSLAWDYAVTDEAAIDRFVLQRKLAAGTYADLLQPAKTLRTINDTSTVAGTVYCYRLYSEKNATPPLGTPIRSQPSNEVCGATIVGVTNLRIQ